MPETNEPMADTIADAVISWMVEQEWLDAGQEYAAADIIAALNDNAPPSQGEPVAVKAALRMMSCPRPCNNRPDDFDVGQCVDAGECGCVAGSALVTALSLAVSDRWYLGSQNDGLFIINQPPRPSNDHPIHDRKDGPTLAIPIGNMAKDKAQAIVDAHNDAIGASHE